MDLLQEQKDELVRRATHAFKCLNEIGDIEREIRLTLREIKKGIVDLHAEDDPDLKDLYETLQRIKGL